MFKKIKVIAILVIIVMTFNFFIPVVYGINVLKETRSTNTNDLKNTVTEKKNSKQLGEPYREPIRSKEYNTPVIIGEDMEKRTLDTKYFLLSNGDTIVAKYPSNVHYDNNGKLENIDNSFVSKTDDENDNILENKANNFKVRFAKKSSKNKLLTLQNKDFKIKWSLENVNKVNAKVTNERIKIQKPQTIEELNNFFMKVKNQSNSVTYENILNNINLKYDIQSDIIKESIILSKKEAIDNKILFNLDLGKLTAEITKDKQIIIYNEKKRKYYICNRTNVYV